MRARTLSPAACAQRICALDVSLSVWCAQRPPSRWQCLSCLLSGFSVMPGRDEHRSVGESSISSMLRHWRSRHVSRPHLSGVMSLSASLLLLAVLTACPVPAPPSPPLPTSPVDPGGAAAKLEFDVPVTGELSLTTRHSFLLKHTSRRDVLLRLSWNDQDGLDRVLIQGGTLSEIMVIDTRERFKLEERLSLDPGFYTIELVPGARAATFNLVLNQAR